MGTGVDETRATRLSKRELEVARLVAEGLTNREIAQRLFISERTVDGHLEHVREKLGVNSRAQIAAWITRQAAAPDTAAQPPAVRTRRPANRRLWVGASAALLAAAEAAVLLLQAAPEGPMIWTVAGGSPVGGGVGSFKGEGVQPTAAVMSLPSDVAVARDGTLYIADYRNRRIRKVAGGSIVTWAGNGKNGELAAGAFAYLVGIGHASNLAVDQDGNVYLLTNSASELQVWMVGSDQKLQPVVDVGPSKVQFGEFWPPPVGGLAIGPTGVIFISDRSGNVVYSYTRGEVRPRRYAGTGSAGFGGDRGAATEAELSHPGGLAVDHQGNLYIADSGNNRIRKVAPNGTITTVAGGASRYYGDSGDGGPAVNARLAFPYGVAVARDGTLYIADTGNNRVRVVSPSGIIGPLAGMGTGGFAGDGGPATNALLGAPEGIALDGKGDLFVADTVNLRIREVVGVDS